MSLVDKIHDKALEKKGLVKKLAVFGSGLADYITATHDEIDAHKAALLNTGDERVDPRDYELYKTSEPCASLGHFLAWLYTAMDWRLRIPSYALGADLLVRYIPRMRINRDGGTLALEIYLDRPGLIGTARSLGYKLADRMGRDEDEPEIEPESVAEIEGDMP